MLSNQIEVEYSGETDAFELDYTFQEFIIETDELKIVLDKNRFIELRDKINKVYEDVI